MNTRKLWLVILLVGLFVISIGAVGAQDSSDTQSALRPERPIRALIGIVVDATGLEARDILGQLRDGLTLADIITANDGDVNQVIADAVAILTDEINQGVADGKITPERADSLLSNLEDVVTQAVNGELSPNRLDRGAVRDAAKRTLVGATADATGLLPQQVIQQLRDGSTLADVITANGGDIDTVVNSAVAAATEQINTAVAEGRLGQEQADQLLANLPDLYQATVNGELRQEWIEQRARLGVLTLAAQQTGLQPREIAQQIRSGKSLADVLTEQGVDVNAFIDSAVAQAAERLDTAVANGRITQERADELLQNFRDRLTEGINQSRPLDVEILTI